MRVSAFIEPCLPSPADRLPSGPDWIHEIKLDDFRMMVRRDPAGVRLLTRNGYDWTGHRRRECCGRGDRRARRLPVTAMGCRRRKLSNWDGPRQAWRPHHARGARHFGLPKRIHHWDVRGSSPPNAGVFFFASRFANRLPEPRLKRAINSGGTHPIGRMRAPRGPAIRLRPHPYEFHL
jgi:hypothetical protein